MKKILIIAGHQNIKYNSDVTLHGNTGTAGELEINIRIADRVSAMLRERGFECTQTDGNANDDKTIRITDFSLALALHCDMDVANDQGGGMCGSGDKSVDYSWEESLRIKKVFDAVYFPETKIVNKNIVTKGMALYYMWKYLSVKTPCVLLEMGQAKDAHDSVLLGNTVLIAGAIVRSICQAFNLPYEIGTPTPPPTNTCLAELVIAKTEIDRLNRLVEQSKSEFKAQLAIKESECLNKMKAYKEKVIQFINSI